MTKLLNIGLLYQDFYHVIEKLCSYAVMQLCSHAVVQSCSRAVVESYNYTVIQSCSCVLRSTSILHLDLSSLHHIRPLQGFSTT